MHRQRKAFKQAFNRNWVDQWFESSHSSQFKGNMNSNPLQWKAILRKKHTIQNVVYFTLVRNIVNPLMVEGGT